MNDRRIESHRDHQRYQAIGCAILRLQRLLANVVYLANDEARARSFALVMRITAP